MVVVAEAVVVALVAVEALGEVPQDMAVALPMGPLPLPMVVLVVGTAMDVSTLQSSRPPVLPCLAGPDAASTNRVCHIPVSCYAAMKLCTAFQAMSISAVSAASASHFGHFQLLHQVQVASAYKQMYVRQHLLLCNEHMLLFMQMVKQHTPKQGEGVATAPTRMLGSRPSSIHPRACLGLHQARTKQEGDNMATTPKANNSKSQV